MNAGRNCPMGKKAEIVQWEKTRSYNFFLARVLKNAGQKKLEFRGIKLCNSLDKNLKSKSFILFEKTTKKNLLHLY